MATHVSNPNDSHRREPSLPPGRLWRQLPLEQRQAAARSFWTDPEGAEQQAEALDWMARQMHFRFKTVERLPLDKKVQHLAALGGLPDAVAIRTLVAYHLEHRREMMSVFLDALGIAHDHGVIATEALQPPETDRLREAASKLRDQYPKDEVDLYFSTLLAQDPATWGGLQNI